MKPVRVTTSETDLGSRDSLPNCSRLREMKLATAAAKSFYRKMGLLEDESDRASGLNDRKISPMSGRALYSFEHNGRNVGEVPRAFLPSS